MILTFIYLCKTLIVWIYSKSISCVPALRVAYSRDPLRCPRGDCGYRVRSSWRSTPSCRAPRGSGSTVRAARSSCGQAIWLWCAVARIISSPTSRVHRAFCTRTFVRCQRPTKPNHCSASRCFCAARIASPATSGRAWSMPFRRCSRCQPASTIPSTPWSRCCLGRCCTSSPEGRRCSTGCSTCSSYMDFEPDWTEARPHRRGSARHQIHVWRRCFTPSTLSPKEHGLSMNSPGSPICLGPPLPAHSSGCSDKHR